MNISGRLHLGSRGLLALQKITRKQYLKRKDRARRRFNKRFKK